MHNILIAGAGFAGSVIANRLKESGFIPIVYEKRTHVGGNCYDEYDSNGILVHKYGPHIFHTNSDEVVTYLSQFTDWRDYQHRVLGQIDDSLIPIPFNFKGLDIFFEKAKLFKELLLRTEKESISILELLQDDNLKEVSNFIYEKVFSPYTQKQWGCSVEEISKEVVSRVPIVNSYDDRYFKDKFQKIPVDGYTALFNNLLKGICVLLDYPLKLTIKDQRIYQSGNEVKNVVVWTGPIDELFNYCFGRLEYRSLHFEHINEKISQKFLVATINYPSSDYPYTRITEFKHITGQKSDSTSYCIEYPEGYTGENVPYYPMFNKENMEKYAEYKKLADTIPNLFLVGRLAEYRYYNMDAVVERALAASKEIINFMR